MEKLCFLSQSFFLSLPSPEVENVVIYAFKQREKEKRVHLSIC